VRPWIIAVVLFFFCFIFPLQFFIIGNGSGMGIQGATYRYQMTVQGDSLIPITNEINYVTRGLYTGRSAFSVIFWVIGTIMLIITTAGALTYWGTLNRKQIRIISHCLIGAGIGYLTSCIAQYGPLLNGPAGISLPFGVVVLVIFAVYLHYYSELFTAEKPDHIM
jgi:hypothetical protein